MKSWSKANDFSTHVKCVQSALSLCLRQLHSPHACPHYHLGDAVCLTTEKRVSLPLTSLFLLCSDSGDGEQLLCFMASQLI